MKVKILSDLPTIEELKDVLQKNLEQYDVEFGWGLAKWINVKYSWATGVNVAINEKKKLIMFIGFFGSRWAFLAGPLLLLFTMSQKKKMINEVDEVIRNNFKCAEKVS